MIELRIKNILLHLRLPFSFFLLPIFIFSLSQSLSIDKWNSIIIFISLHLFIYPASNAYNSFMDRDTGSIGALKNPPPVSRGLYLASIWLDIIGVLLLWLIDFRLIFLMLVYIGVSKSYSWTGIRLKKYPYIGWLTVVVFQGGYTFMLVSMSSESVFSIEWFSLQKAECMILSTLLIGAYYPLTQIYQHEEDSKRGDYTISYRLGIRGTFLFSALLFFVSVMVALHYFGNYYSYTQFMVFCTCLLPAIIYFLIWFLKTENNIKYASFSHAMHMTIISSTCLTIGFIILFLINHY